MFLRNKIILLALVIFISLPAQAALLEYSVDQMVESSEAIVQGRVISLESRWLDGPGSIIVTDVSFVVDQVWEGKISTQQRLNFYVAGGFVDGLGMRQEHAPIFSQGEEAVLFLWTQPDQDRLAVFNDEQGRYRIVDGSALNFKEQSIDLSEFRGNIERAVQIHGR